MYYPFALEQLRLQQAEIDRRAAAPRWVEETIGSRRVAVNKRRQWRRPGLRGSLRLAFAGLPGRRAVCTDC